MKIPRKFFRQLPVILKQFKNQSSVIFLVLHKNWDPNVGEVPEVAPKGSIWKNKLHRNFYLTTEILCRTANMIEFLGHELLEVFSFRLKFEKSNDLLRIFEKIPKVQNKMQNFSDFWKFARLNQNQRKVTKVLQFVLDFWDSSKTFSLKCLSVAHFYLPFHAGVALSTDNSITAKNYWHFSFIRIKFFKVFDVRVFVNSVFCSIIWCDKKWNNSVEFGFWSFQLLFSF